MFAHDTSAIHPNLLHLLATHFSFNKTLHSFKNILYQNIFINGYVHYKKYVITFVVWFYRNKIFRKSISCDLISDLFKQCLDSSPVFLITIISWGHKYTHKKH